MRDPKERGGLKNKRGTREGASFSPNNRLYRLSPSSKTNPTGTRLKGQEFYIFFIAILKRMVRTSESKLTVLETGHFFFFFYCFFIQFLGT